MQRRAAVWPRCGMRRAGAVIVNRVGVVLYVKSGVSGVRAISPGSLTGFGHGESGKVVLIGGRKDAGYQANSCTRLTGWASGHCAGLRYARLPSLPTFFATAFLGFGGFWLRVSLRTPVGTPVLLLRGLTNFGLGGFFSRGRAAQCGGSDVSGASERAGGIVVVTRKEIAPVCEPGTRATSSGGPCATMVPPPSPPSGPMSSR